jgi:hypothetical protein
MTRMTRLGAMAFGLFSLAVPATAYAQYPAAAIPLRLLSDPAYLPYQGQLYGSSAFSMSESSGDRYDSTGAEISRDKGWQDTITQELEYGITNDLALRIGDSYVPFDKDKDTFTAGGFADRKSDGFTDPSIGLTWRMIDQAHNSPLNFDLLADYSPNMIGARTTNLARGGQTADVGAAISEVMPHFTVYGKALAEWNGQQGEYNPLSTDFTRMASRWDYLLDLDTQTRFNQWLSFNAGVGYVFAGNARVANLTTGVDHTLEPGDGLKLDAALNYQLVPNTFVASLTYDYRRDNTTDTVFAIPTSDTSLHNRTDNTFGVKFDYLLPY